MPFQFRKEAIEEDLNTNFPSQGQGNPPLYYSLSEVVVPTYSINQAAEGTTLPQNLQTAWDFSTGINEQTGFGSTNIITNTGFWQIYVQAEVNFAVAGSYQGQVRIFDGVTQKIIWQVTDKTSNHSEAFIVTDNLTVFVRSGDSVNIRSDSANINILATYRQIADVNGNLVNPLGFSAA
jgi:hypothetical protein